MVTPGPKKQIAGNMVRAAYEHSMRDEKPPAGEKATDGWREYMDWCEERVHEWKTYIEGLGYAWPCYCVKSEYSGKPQTYHEWLLERVGL